MSDRTVDGAARAVNSLVLIPINGFVGIYSAGNDGRIYRVDRPIPRPLVGTPPSFNGAEVNHQDTNKRNNAPENLEWTTSSGNKLHAVAMGVMIPPGQPGEKHPQAKLTWEDVREIRATIGQIGNTEIARKFGVTKQAIQKIRKGLNWRVA